jgi:hypothetical protein
MKNYILLLVFVFSSITAWTQHTFLFKRFLDDDGIFPMAVMEDSLGNYLIVYEKGDIFELHTCFLMVLSPEGKFIQEKQLDITGNHSYTGFETINNTYYLFAHDFTTINKASLILLKINKDYSAEKLQTWSLNNKCCYCPKIVNQNTNKLIISTGLYQNYEDPHFNKLLFIELNNTFDTVRTRLISNISLSAIEYNKHKAKFVVFGDNESHICIADINLDLEIVRMEYGYIPGVLPDFRFIQNRFLAIGSSESGNLIELVMIDSLVNRNEHIGFGEQNKFQQMAFNRSIVNTTNGQFYGFSFQWDGYLSYSANPLNLHLVKFDSSMNIIFERFYEDKASHFAMDFAATRDRGCVMAAHIYDTTVSTEYYGIQILKVDSLGNFVPNSIETTSLDEEQWHVYPNPGSNELNITWPANHQNTTISLYNISGKKVISKALQNSQALLNTTELPTGIYIWEVQTSTGNFERGKWIKQ